MSKKEEVAVEEVVEAAPVSEFESLCRRVCVLEKTFQRHGIDLCEWVVPEEVAS